MKRSSVHIQQVANGYLVEYSAGEYASNHIKNDEQEIFKYFSEVVDAITGHFEEPVKYIERPAEYLYDKDDGFRL